MKKKYAIIGIMIIVLLGLGCFAVGGYQSDDVSADVKQEKKIETAKEDVEKTDTIEESDTNSTTSESKDSKANKSEDKVSKTENKTNKQEKEPVKNSTSEKKEEKPTTTPEKHKHSWTAVYKEVDNGEYEITTTKTPWAQCNRCGADITSNPNGHLKMHLDNGETEKVSWSTKYRYEETKTWVPKIEKVVSYYKCSCGATKSK